MATLEDLGVSAFINILGAFVFLILFAVLRIQPVNDRVYFPKLYLAGKRHQGRSYVVFPWCTCTMVKIYFLNRSLNLTI